MYGILSNSVLLAKRCLTIKYCHYIIAIGKIRFWTMLKQNKICRHQEQLFQVEQDVTVSKIERFDPICFFNCRT